MPPTTTSVYLDEQPRPSRRPAVPHVNRRRVVVAGTCVAIGLIALTVAALVAGVRLLTAEPGAAVAAFDAALENPDARLDLERELATKIEQDWIGPDAIAAVAAFGVDVGAEAEAAAPALLADPAVTDEIRSLITAVHHQVIVDADPTVIDQAPLTAAIVPVLERESPVLASMIPAGATLLLIDPETLPDWNTPADVMNRTRLLVLVLVLLAPLGALIHPRRHVVASWAGRWALTFGLFCAFCAVGLPYVAGELSASAALEAAIRPSTVRLIAPAALAGIMGTGLVAFAAVARRREERRVIEEGAAAALGYDEPPMWAQTRAPSIELPARGLVDANHPLTNI